MISFIGNRSIILITLTGLTGLVLAGVEIILSGYLIKLMELIGVGEKGASATYLVNINTVSTDKILAGFIVMSAIKSLLLIGKGYCAVNANEAFIARLRYLCVSSTIHKLGVVAPPSETYSLVSDVFLKSALTFYGIAHAIPMFIQSVLLFIFLLFVSTHLSLAGLTFVVGVGTIVYALQKRISQIVEPLSEINNNLYATIKRILDNLLIIRISKIENEEINKLSATLKGHLKRVKQSNLLALISENVPTFFGSIVLATLFLMQLSSPEFAPSIFVAFVYVFIRLIQSLSQMVSFFGTALINFPYFKTAYYHYQQLPKHYIKLVEKNPNAYQVDLDALNNTHRQKDRAQKLDGPPSIVVSNLSFQYSDKTPLINNLSFTLNPGCKCNIVGRSGAGKSTLLQILLGELQASSGSIKINSHRPDNFIHLYNEDIAYAGTNPFQFEGSIRENLLYGNDKDILDSEISELLSKLGLDDWLSQINCDLSLGLGYNGVSTSVGQSQRLELARALLRKPRLLILDEITSNLDAETEALVTEQLNSLDGKTTILAVTHGKSMVREKDVVVEI